MLSLNVSYQVSFLLTVSFCRSILQNWRAALALFVTIPLGLPGLINVINPKIDVGSGTHLFEISYIMEVRPTDGSLFFFGFTPFDRELDKNSLEPLVCYCGCDLLRRFDRLPSYGNSSLTSGI
jgi:hypothetical protein